MMSRDKGRMINGCLFVHGMRRVRVVDAGMLPSYSRILHNLICMLWLDEAVTFSDQDLIVP